jgi:ABC-type phosphate transport system substrate-binding protein
MKSVCGIALVVAVVLACYAAPSISEDEYVIVANKQMAGGSIGVAQLKGIYLREVKSWGNGGGDIVVVDLSNSNSFYQNLFGKTYVQMQAYWLNQRIKYSVDLPVTKKDAEGVKQFVADKKGAIGFLKAGDVDDRVKVLKVVN